MYTEKEMIDFGNYILSEERRSKFDPTFEYINSVNDTDLDAFHLARLGVPNEDQIAHQIAVSKADDMVSNYKQYGDNNWNITI